MFTMRIYPMGSGWKWVIYHRGLVVDVGSGDDRERVQRMAESELRWRLSFAELCR